MELLVDHAIATAVGDMFPSESPVSHYDLDVAFTRFGLRTADPRIALPDQMHGKGKRVKAVLTHAADTSPNEGGKLVIFLMAQMRGGGAFRADSVCCLQDDVVANARAALKSAGFDLAGDGALGPLVLENLSGRDLTQALATYVERARSGSTDAALVTGTGKDLVEATARHVLVERQGGYQPQMNFPGTLHQAYAALELSAPLPPAVDKINEQLSEDPVRRVQECLYILGVAVNRLRNDQGSGHGRPFPVTVGADDARLGTEAMGLLAGLLLDRL